METTPLSQLKPEDQRLDERLKPESTKSKIAAAVGVLVLTVSANVSAIAAEKKASAIEPEEEKETLDVPPTFCKGKQESMVALGGEIVGQDGDKYYFPPKEECKTGYLSEETVSAASPDHEQGYPSQVELECDFTANRGKENLTAVCGPKGKEDRTTPFVGIAPLTCKLGTGTVVSGDPKQLPVVMACKGEGGHGYRGEFSPEESKEGRLHELRMPLRERDLDRDNRDEFIRNDINVTLKHTSPEQEKPKVQPSTETKEKPAPKKGKK